VQIIPFQAFRYDEKKVGDLGQVISPPYDQISPEMQEALYKRHPYNFVRLIFGKIFPSDNEQENRYTRAVHFFEKWCRDGVLKQEKEESFYVYEQTFYVPGKGEFTRRGFVGLIRLAPLGKGVLPHEKTFPKPKEDRLNLLRACKANFEHVFFLYDDPKQKIEVLLAGSAQGEPFLFCKDEAGTTHRLWKILPATGVALSEFFQDKELLIADGHHRYETSLAYEKEMEQKYGNMPNAPFHFRLGTFVSLQNPGLVILPTYRVIRNLSSEALFALQKELPNYFRIEPLESLDLLLKKMEGKKHVFGMATDGTFQLLALKEGFDFDAEFPMVPSVLRKLDVFVLHALILERLLHLPQDKLDEVISYVRWSHDAYDLLKKGEKRVAFFLNPVKPEDVKEVAQAGEKMPHKSTDFYPKLWSGLLFYKMHF
jgi:uncharacterized protein (DUF1015 family)